MTQRRYKWSHEELPVLREIAKMVKEKRKSHNKETIPPEKLITFVKSREKKTSRVQVCQHSYLDGAIDWKMKLDFGNNLKFSREIETTSQRKKNQQIVLLLSNNTFKVGLVELSFARGKS